MATNSLSGQTPQAYVTLCTAIQKSAKARHQAIELTDRGERDKARELLEGAVRQLLALEIPTAETLRREIQVLQKYADMLKAKPETYVVLRKTMRQDETRSMTMRLDVPRELLRNRARRRHPWPKAEDDPDAPLPRDE